jgi:hypothetical protein
MRYYAIVICGAPASFPVRYDGGAQWGTEFNGQYDPGAQQVDDQRRELTRKHCEHWLQSR